MMPRNLDAETALLSLAFFNNDLSEAIEIVKPSDFYDTTHQQLWEAITTLYSQGSPVDIVALSDELKKQNLDPKSAMDTALSVFDSPTVVGGNMKRFAEAVRNTATLRKLLVTLDSSSQHAQTTGTTPAEVILELEKKLVELSEQVIDSRPQDSDGILKEVEVDIANTTKFGWKGIKTGWDAVDNATGGLIPTHTWVLGAYTGTGKTFWLLQLALNVLKQGKRVLIVSTEMDRKMNILRMLGNLSGISSLNIMRGYMDDYQLEQLEKAKAELRSYAGQLFIVDNVRTAHEIRLKAKKIKLEQGGLDVVIVDFIQNLKGAENIYENMSQAAIDLQEMAQTLQVCMVIASQVSQSGASWGGNTEVIEYKGAGEIAAAADVGLWLRKIPDKKAGPAGLADFRTGDGGVVTHRWLYLRKVRHGEPGKVTLRMDFPAGTVTQIQEQSHDPGKQENFLEELETTGGGDDFEP
jgi:replicative DNA helicase